MTRPLIDVAAPVGGWQRPWPAVAELATVLPSEHWTLVGGLMTQLHAIHHGLGVVRPTNDVDIVLHIETSRGVPGETARALKSLGYELRLSVDPRDNTAHRFIRGRDVVDLVTSTAEADDRGDVIDVLISDHAAPSVTERLLGRDMVRMAGGTQALRRTVNARLRIVPGEETVVSVPRPFGALVLKAAAYRADRRDRGRHLTDAAALLACVEDPITERGGFSGSDRKRILMLKEILADDHVAWLDLPEAARQEARAALRLLAQG